MTKEKAYRQQMDKAKHCGIPWEFTMKTWWAIWEKSGKWGKRGRGGNKFVMGRRGDIGPYSPANVYICTGRTNRRHSAKNMNTKEWEVGKSPRIKTVCKEPSAEKVAWYVNNICQGIHSKIIERVVFDPLYDSPIFLT